MGLRLGNTLFLAACAAVISVPLAILLGLIAVRYRGYRGYGAAELYVPVFEGRDIHVLTYAPRPWYDRVSCVADTVVSCPLP